MRWLPLIPFNKPYYCDKGIHYIKEVLDRGKVGADGYFTKKCKNFLEKRLRTNNILLTTSCTHALEMAFRLINLEKNQEVIMPSYTFPSTSNCVLMNNGKVVFTEINHNDLCIDADKIEEKITDKTKAIIVVHYGGNACDMDKIMSIANRYDLYVIEDAAQGLFSTYKGKELGTIGHFGCYSFHETKNISSGEGGAISINFDDDDLIKRAEYMRQKGTNRIDFELGQVEFYQWVDIGSSYCPSEILMAYLYSQLENSYDIHVRRLEIFNGYVNLFESLKSKKIINYAIGNQYGAFNAHIFYVIFEQEKDALVFANRLKDEGIIAYTHLIPLHLSRMGLQMGYREDDFPFEKQLYKRLIRLPLYADMTDIELCRVQEVIQEIIEKLN
jgi:dTDP-4-amino-4,6-dideoxygalactose transaminase